MNLAFLMDDTQGRKFLARIHFQPEKTLQTYYFLLNPKVLL